MTITVRSQITITNADLPAPGDIFIYDLSTDLMSEDFTLTGSNYSWDYSTGSSNSVDSIKIVFVGSTPFAYQFYFNNQWTQPDHFSDYARAGQDINAFNQVTIEERFDYFGINSNSLEMKGFGAKVNGVPASIKYDTIDQLYPFPMTDGMATHNSSGYYLATVPNLGTYGQWIRREVTVDGYGSLTTPNATYSNTLRVKTVLQQTDTFYIDQFSFGQTFDRPEEIHYEWFTNSESTPVMKVVMRNNQANEVRYLLEITSGMDELETEDFDLVTLSSGVYAFRDLNVINVSVFNIKGQNIGQYQSDNIDISNFADGVYLILLRTENSSYCFKVIK